MVSMVEGWDTVEINKRGDIEEPADPAARLLKLLRDAPDAPLDSEHRGTEEVAARRRLLEQTFARLPQVARRVLQSFADSYRDSGFPITGELRFYVVGGRTEGKGVRAGTDIDIAITLANGNVDLRRLYGDEPREASMAKLKAARAFVDGPFMDVMRFEGLIITERISADETAAAPLLEPKEYGIPDDAFRANGLPAILISRLAL